MNIEKFIGSCILIAFPLAVVYSLYTPQIIKDVVSLLTSGALSVAMLALGVYLFIKGLDKERVK